MRILIAEDDSMPRKLLTKMLSGWGYEVLVAEDGLQAYDLFLSSPPSMVISDWMMPRGTGVELCQKIRAFQGRKYTYFILVTSRSDKESLLEAMSAGADDFIGKPYDEQELHARIRSGERILALSHELARRLEQLSMANECIGRINLQMTHDVRALLLDIRRWADESLERDQSPAEKELRAKVQTEVQQVVQNWINSLKPLADEAKELMSLGKKAGAETAQATPRRATSSTPAMRPPPKLPPNLQLPAEGEKPAEPPGE